MSEDRDFISYEGKVKILEFDLTDPKKKKKLNDELEDFIDTEEGEEIYPKIDGDILEVKKIKKKEG